MFSRLARWKTLLSAWVGSLTVRQQIGLAAALLCVALVTAIAGSAAVLGARQTSKLVRQDLAGTAQVFADRLDRTLATRYREIRILASLEPMQSVWQGDVGRLRTTLEQVQGSFPDYSWIGFARPDGQIAAATGGLLEGVSVAARPWFRNGLQGPAVEDVHEALLLERLLGPNSSGQPFRFVDVAFPVKDKDGRTIGVLGAHLSWEFASTLRQAILHAVNQKHITDLLILARDGKVLLGGTLGSAALDGAQLQMIRDAHDGTFTSGAGRNETLGAFARAAPQQDYPGLGWTVVALQPSAAALAPVSELIRVVLGVGAAGALIGIVLALWIAGRIARPLHRLTVEADRLGRDAGTITLSRHDGSREVVQLSTALRSLLRRIGFAEERSQQAELREAENAKQYARDVQTLRHMADSDPLTHLMNRRAFLAAANDAMSYFQRYQRPIATLLIDIDHFKRINDTHGHAAGDAVIKRVGELIQETLRGTDKVGRFGGEEFVVLLREVDEETARTLAKRIQEGIAAAPVRYGALEIPVTVSVGVALAIDADRDVQETIERADRGLYMAKNTGRNRVFYMPSTPASQKAA